MVTRRRSVNIARFAVPPNRPWPDALTLLSQFLALEKRLSFANASFRLEREVAS